MSLDSCYRGARVLLTGDTGFKGSWLACWLEALGAEVHGIGLAPETQPSLFEVLDLPSRIRHRQLDVRDRQELAAHVRELRPKFVFHLAAQALVRRSLHQPLATLDTNVMGTAHVLAAVSGAGYVATDPCAVVVVTSDKCYENRETATALREDEPMGGHDIYSVSKGMAELLVTSWRRSYCRPENHPLPAVRIATARAGNVIGGGDWAEDRILPDSVRALSRGRAVGLRNPLAQRPWQHVLEPLGGYLHLGALLTGTTDRTLTLCTGFNFGPDSGSERTVGELCSAVIKCWGRGTWRPADNASPVHEAQHLRLVIDKARDLLGWRPRWTFEQAVARTVDWYRRGVECNHDAAAMWALTRAQIADFSDARCNAAHDRVVTAGAAPVTP